MKTEWPISLSGELLTGVLEGRKTQARAAEGLEYDAWQVGDVLWLREPHWIDCRDPLALVMDVDGYVASQHLMGMPTGKFVSDMRNLLANRFWKKHHQDTMLQWASRIRLEIAGVRVEHLMDISEADAITEGIEREPNTAHWKNYENDELSVGWRYWESPVQSFRTLWNKHNGQDSFHENPLVRVFDLTMKV